jgi:hypothetical protein
MAKNVKKIAKALGAKMGPAVPDTGGGTFGMARLAAVLAARLKPSQGKRPGRPSDPSWTHTAKVPMSDETIEQLDALAESVSTPQRKISRMQVAAQLLEDSLNRVGSESDTIA